MAQAVEEVQQVPRVGVVERRGGLIQDQQLDALGERLGDLDELLLADADVLDLGVRALGQADAREQLIGLDSGVEPVDDPTSRALVAQEEVLHDAQLGDQRQLLVNDHDARSLTLADAFELADLVLEDDLAVVRAERIDAGEDLHQSGLARAVLAADRMDLTASDVQGDVRQRLDAGKLLGDPLHGENRVVHMSTPSGKRRKPCWTATDRGSGPVASTDGWLGAAVVPAPSHS